MPSPGTHRYSDIYAGRVLDAETQIPVPGAKVEIAEFPSTATLSAKDGSFEVSPATFTHLAYVGWDPVGEWPNPGAGLGDGIAFVLITHDAFLPKYLCERYSVTNKVKHVDIGDVQLERMLK